MSSDRQSRLRIVGRSPKIMALLMVGGLNFLESTLYSLILPLLPAYTTQLQLSDVQVGLLFSVYAVALLPASWCVNALSQRFPPQRLLMGGVILLLVSTLVCGHVDFFWGLFVARMIQGAASAIPMTVGPALVAAHYPPSRRGWALGVVSGMSLMGYLAGPLIGGALGEWGGLQAPFLVVSAAMAAPAVLLMPLLRRLSLTPSHDDARPKGAHPAWLALLRRPAVLLPAAIACIGVMILTAIEPILPLVLSRRFHASPLTFSLLCAAMVVFSALIAPLVGGLSDRMGRLPVCVFGLVSCLFSCGAYTFAPSVLWFLGAMLCNAASVSLVLLPAHAALADSVDALHADEHEREAKEYTAASAIYNTASAVGMLVGPLLSTGLLSWGQGAAFWLLGFAGFASGLGIFFAYTRGRAAAVSS